MDFDIPADLRDTLKTLDAFIAAEIRPLERAHPQFFDHRREHARTDWDRDGLPRKEWEELLGEMRRRADRAGFFRYALPKKYGGRDGSNLAVTVIREHLASLGLGLHADLQSETSVVGSFTMVQVFDSFGTEEQKAQYIEGMITGERRIAFGLTEPDHGSDATWLETTAVRDGEHWVLNGAKRFNSAVHTAHANLVFARTSGQPGDAEGISAFLVPMDTPGMKVEYYHWTFNMPTDHAEVSLKDVRVPASALVGKLGGGLAALPRRAVALHWTVGCAIRPLAPAVHPIAIRAVTLAASTPPPHVQALIERLRGLDWSSDQAVPTVDVKDLAGRIAIGQQE